LLTPLSHPCVPTERHNVHEDRDDRGRTRGFIVGGNCLLADGFIDELVFLTTYCTQDYMPQLPPFQRRALASPNATGFWPALYALANRPEAQYHGQHERWTDDGGHETEEEWQGWGTWLSRRSLAWVRPKSGAGGVAIRGSPRSDWRRSLSRQQWLRATAQASFDLWQWLLNVIDSLFGTGLAMSIANFFDDIKAWFENENEDWCLGVQTGVGVGFAYWVKFWVRCEFQPRPGTLPCNAANNLNCKIGIGLEAAIGWVTLYMVAAYIVIALFLSPLTILFSLIPALLLWLIIVPAVAWHYSPRCWLMTPAAIIPGRGWSSFGTLSSDLAFGGAQAKAPWASPSLTGRCPLLSPHCPFA
jgi:hypothetical protein